MIEVHEVLDFWFAGGCATPEAATERNQFWFTADPEVDREIWQRFGDDLQDAATGRYDEWASEARGRLALVPRNMLRGN